MVMKELFFGKIVFSIRVGKQIKDLNDRVQINRTINMRKEISLGNARR
jgi:hypothetical protein